MSGLSGCKSKNLLHSVPDEGCKKGLVPDKTEGLKNSIIQYSTGFCSSSIFRISNSENILKNLDLCKNFNIVYPMRDVDFTLCQFVVASW
jgi:hypothetical protein